jgi:hypothetical protein
VQISTAPAGLAAPTEPPVFIVAAEKPFGSRKQQGVPLKRGSDQPCVVGDVVQFVMEDIRTGDSVTCQITIEALRRWLADISEPSALSYPGDGLAFLMLRDAIEDAANHAYLQGEKAPRLR